jgi:dienelactone hydrolase
MYAQTSTLLVRKWRPGMAAGTVLAMALAVSACGGAQTSTPPANKTAIAPKQVGAWTVTGYSEGYCAAERPVSGADGGAGGMQFQFARQRSGYRIALSAQEWDLTPQTSFPVQLIPDPVLRSNAKAIAATPKTVIIELGTDGQSLNRLATVSTLEVRAAQTTFKLPMEGLSQALAEVDACFGALKQPLSNPFVAPRPDPARDSRALTAEATTSDGTTEAAPARFTLASASSAAAPAKVRVEDGLIEEHTFLTVPTDKGSYRLEALVVRPETANRRLPIALITHGKNATAVENQGIRADLMRPQARDFAARGWLAVVIIRRGYGQSDGLPGLSRGAAYMSCENADLARGFDVEAEDLDGALKALAARPDADPSRVIAIGQSLGGGAVLAFAARQPAGLLGVVNVSGGVSRTNGDSTCDQADLVAAMASFGSRTRVPTLWLYAENDSLFPPALVGTMRDAYTHAGGRAKLRMFPPVEGDGHSLFMDFTARTKWLHALDVFLQAYRMPNANLARADWVMTSTRLAASTRADVEEYFSSPMPKVLVASASGRQPYWVADSDDIDGARQRVLTTCHEQSGGECTVLMENNELVRPLASDTITGKVTAR